jgi:hypothetical protein
MIALSGRSSSTSASQALRTPGFATRRRADGGAGAHHKGSGITRTNVLRMFPEVPEAAKTQLAE